MVVQKKNSFYFVTALGLSNRCDEKKVFGANRQVIVSS